MFGHQDNQSTDQSDHAAKTDSVQDSTTTTPVSQTSAYQPAMPPGSNLDTPSDPSSQASSNTPSLQHPVGAIEGPNDRKDDIISPAGGFPQALSSKEPVLSLLPTAGNHTHLNAPTSTSDNQLTEATDDNLIEVKQKALEELFPLIDKLDQTPEEEFKTLMMIIQASDNHTLIEKAYEIAKTIDDEKERAQALLDIVNEINYFTQQPEV
ncbi:MAG TPA: hypothetical protein VNG32_03405 [Candidatus Dormibacteraeota bacterium]|nr:hypothetical protein [Candidatus Dormibacteraeota bacterium]